MAKVQQKFQFPKTYRIKIRFHDMIKAHTPYSVADHSPCRNNSDKNLAKFLESAVFHHTFAVSKGNNDNRDKKRK